MKALFVKKTTIVPDVGLLEAGYGPFVAPKDFRYSAAIQLAVASERFEVREVKDGTSIEVLGETQTLTTPKSTEKSKSEQIKKA